MGSLSLAPPGKAVHFGAFFKISIVLKMWPYQSEDDNLSGNWPAKKKKNPVTSVILALLKQNLLSTH